jgi:hypothetical protein
LQFRPFNRLCHVVLSVDQIALDRLEDESFLLEIG